MFNYSAYYIASLQKIKNKNAMFREEFEYVINSISISYPIFNLWA